MERNHTGLSNQIHFSAACQLCTPLHAYPLNTPHSGSSLWGSHSPHPHPAWLPNQGKQLRPLKGGAAGVSGLEVAAQTCQPTKSFGAEGWGPAVMLLLCAASGTYLELQTHHKGNLHREAE